MTAELIKRINEAEEKIANSNAGTVLLDKYSLGPWSPSKLKTAEKCPFQFYLQYILKVKNDEAVEQDTLLADIGTSAHKILEHIVLGKNVEDAYKAAKFEHCDTLPEDRKKGGAYLTPEQWESEVIPMEYNIIQFKERLDKFFEKVKVKKALTELRVAVTKDWKPTSFFANNVYFRGIIDLVLLIDTGPTYRPDMLIIDHKSGGGEHSNSLKNYEQQLNAYLPLFHYGVEKVSGGQVGVNFIRAGKLITNNYVDAETIETDMVQRLEWLLTCAIDSIKEKGFFKHIRGPHCTYCPFDPQCKAGELKEIEKGTKKYFEIKEIK
jgi:hypothetical protein